jgi:hypothetical protein
MAENFTTDSPNLADKDQQADLHNTGTAPKEAAEVSETLMGLPTEIRQTIFRHLCGKALIHWHARRVPPNRPALTTSLLVSKQYFAEAREQFLRTATANVWAAYNAVGIQSPSTVRDFRQLRFLYMSGSWTPWNVSADTIAAVLRRMSNLRCLTLRPNSDTSDLRLGEDFDKRMASAEGASAYPPTKHTTDDAMKQLGKTFQGLLRNLFSQDATPKFAQPELTGILKVWLERHRAFRVVLVFSTYRQYEDYAIFGISETPIDRSLLGWCEPEFDAKLTPEWVWVSSQVLFPSTREPAD